MTVERTYSFNNTFCIVEAKLGSARLRLSINKQGYLVSDNFGFTPARYYYEVSRILNLWSTGELFTSRCLSDDDSNLFV